MKILLLTTALLSASTLAAQAQSQDRSANADCDRLIAAIQNQKVPSGAVTLDQARTYKRDGKDAACRKVLADNNVKADNADRADGSHIDVQQPAARIQVQQPTADVRVRQARPDVTVSQGQPEITVHQPAPTVRVDIPQPTVTVRMPRPDVNVAQAKPQVDVSQAQPKVSVVQPQDNAKVALSGGNQQANVDYERTGQSPKIRYERETANVVVNQPDGQPKVNVVQDGSAAGQTAAMNARDDDTRGGNTYDRADTTGTNRAGTSEIAVYRLTSMQLYNGAGNALGDVERVVRGNGGQTSIVIGRGGFLGLGERQVAVPLDKVVYTGNRLVTHDLTDEQIKAMPTWNRDGATEMGSNQKVNVSTNG